MRLLLIIFCLMVLTGVVVGLYRTGHWLSATLIITHLFVAFVGVVIGGLLEDLIE